MGLIIARINKAPIAIEAVKRIDALFAIEREINGLTPHERRNPPAAPGGGRLAARTVWALTVLMNILSDSHQVRRLEVADSGRRRRWTESEKLKILHESLSGPRLTAATARRYGISRQLLLNWRKALREGRLGGEAAAARFVPAIVTAGPESAGERSGSKESRVEIVTENGRRVIVEASVDVTVLVRIVRGREQL
jgi:transposase